MAKLALSVLPASRIHLIDSKPLPVVNPKSPFLGKRSSWSKFPEARKGFSTMGMVFGFKLHTLTNLEGLFERWAFATANHPDVRLTRELVDPKLRSEEPVLRSRSCPPLGLEGQLVLGDKAYIGSGVLTPKRSNMTRSSNEAVLVRPWGSNGAWSESLDRTRTRSENGPKRTLRVYGLNEAALVPPKGGPRRP